MTQSQKKLRWGIVSTAAIGMEQVTPAIQAAPNAIVTAIASRGEEKARAAADRLGIEKAYGSYEALLADPEIDAIYNPLPNHLHVDVTLQAAAAGKHVLCEKPIGLTHADAARLQTAPKDIIIAEAFMVRHHPQWHRTREIAQSGELGDVRLITAIFTYFNDDAANVRNIADIGGGGLLDIGCYCVTAGRFMFDTEPRRVVSLVDRDANFGTDRQTSAIVDFGEGRQLSFAVSTQLSGAQRVNVHGTKGRAEIVIPFNAPANQATAILVDKGESKSGDLARREIIAPINQYTAQAEAFGRAVLDGETPAYGIEDALNSMKVLDALFESERTGGWVSLD